MLKYDRLPAHRLKFGTFNRTLVVLKVSGDCGGSEVVRAFNRTLVVLKDRVLAQAVVEDGTFNRTLVVLKVGGAKRLLHHLGNLQSDPCGVERGSSYAS